MNSKDVYDFASLFQQEADSLSDAFELKDWDLARDIAGRIENLSARLKLKADTMRSYERMAQEMHTERGYPYGEAIEAVEMSHKAHVERQMRSQRRW